MLNFFITNASVIAGVLAVVLSFINNFRKANKSDVNTLLDNQGILERDLAEQKATTNRLQQQLDLKNKQIAELQKENALEDQILENRSPDLEETLALLAHGQANILELLKGVSA